MSERRLPIYARWTLLAQGMVERPRYARAQCPVAHWLVDQRKDLVPRDPDLERLQAIRVRSEVVDTLMLQIRDDAERAGHRLSVWTLGAGFDARWARLSGPLSPVVDRWVEVDDPRVVATKRVVLTDSPFDGLWEHVETVPMIPAGWEVTAQLGEWPIIVLEGLLHRLPAPGLRGLLARLRLQAPGASVLLDLTGVQGAARAGWSDRRMRELGWRIADDVELPFRDVMYSAKGDELCSGMVPVRVLHLVGV